MTGLDFEVWDDPVCNFHRILVNYHRTGVPEDAVTRAARAPAALWNLRLAESVGEGASDAVVVALDMSSPQARRRKKLVSSFFHDYCRSEVGNKTKRATYSSYLITFESSACISITSRGIKSAGSNKLKKLCF
jgi:hypothetical protein